MGHQCMPALLVESGCEPQRLALHRAVIPVGPGLGVVEPGVRILKAPAVRPGARGLIPGGVLKIKRYHFAGSEIYGP